MFGWLTYSQKNPQLEDRLCPVILRVALEAFSYRTELFISNIEVNACNKLIKKRILNI